jgi:uncharacterized protein YjbI with pentapeptide repeats
MGKDELQLILENHKKWLNGKEDGIRANLYGANLESANLYGANLIYLFGPIGNHKRICFAVKHAEKVMFKIGCFWGDLEQAKEAIQKEYGENSLYEKQCVLASEVLNG